MGLFIIIRISFMDVDKQLDRHRRMEPKTIGC